jgi:hypothetical protein
MNRTSAAAVAVAAIVGIAGGTYAASLGLGPGGDDGQNAGEQQTKETPTSPTPTRSEENRAPSSPAQLL